MNADVRKTGLLHILLRTCEMSPPLGDVALELRKMLVIKIEFNIYNRSKQSRDTYQGLIYNLILYWPYFYAQLFDESDDKMMLAIDDDKLDPGNFIALDPKYFGERIADIKERIETARIKKVVFYDKDCPLCHNRGAIRITGRTRAGDEEATTIYRCNHCHAHYK
jgi:DNA-directed RNA polymerase subunit M/transcription elongation factor TFIIS